MTRPIKREVRGGTEGARMILWAVGGEEKRLDNEQGSRPGYLSQLKD